MKFRNRAQNYYFLGTQPNKLHKIDRNVRISVDLCNIIYALSTYLTTTFFPSCI